MDPESDHKNKIPDSDGQWHRLGDAGYMDGKNRLWVCGRVGQRVKAANGPVFSLRAEPIFDSHPQVDRSGLVGVPYNGAEVPVICIQLKKGFDGLEADIRKSLLELATQHRTTESVKHVLFIEKWPVDPRHNSKIERPALAKWATKNFLTHQTFPKKIG